MKSSIPVYLLLIVAGACAGWLMRGGEPQHSGLEVFDSHDQTQLDELAAEILALQDQLSDEQAQRAALEQQLAVRQAADSDAAADSAETDADPARPADSASRSSIPELDELTAAGIALATAEAIRARVSQNRLAMLSLRDHAQREGWLNSSRYAQELARLMELSQDIQEQFGDDVFDRYLYATEKANRVLAVAVYPNSSAAASGILPGDIVLSYGQQNIYSMNDLKQATLAGEVGESVLVVVERDGYPFSITVPRGPLGIEMRMERIAPE